MLFILAKEEDDDDDNEKDQVSKNSAYYSSSGNSIHGCCKTDKLTGGTTGVCIIIIFCRIFSMKKNVSLTWHEREGEVAGSSAELVL